MKLFAFLLLTLAAVLPASAAPVKEWQVTESIPIGSVAVALVKDPTRPCLYALNHAGSELLFIDLETKTVQKLYVGKLPTSLAMSRDSSKLYVANRGPGSNTPGGYQISVVDPTTRTKLHHFLTNNQPVNIVCGANDRLYYNNGTWESGAIYDSFGLTGVVDLKTETDLGPIGDGDPYYIKSHMVMNPAGTKLYGQYIYYGNLGEMGVFDMEAVPQDLIDHHRYSRYPYGWDYNNYSISADGNSLAYGKVLFNANNLLDQYGVFPELVHALNGDATLAFGRNSIWDTTSFAETGDATPLLTHGLDLSIMTFDPAGNCLYAYVPSDQSIKKLEFAEVIAPATPDASISASPTTGFVGKGIINAGATRQMVSRLITPWTFQKFYVRVVNETTIPSKMRVSGTPSNEYFKFSYFDEKGKDITAAVTSGIYLTHTLANTGTKARFKIRVKALKKELIGGNYVVGLKFQSVLSPFKTDAVGILVRTE